MVDRYQRPGIGAALMRHLAILARAGGFEEFVAEVLPETAPMLRVFEKSGLAMKTTRDASAHAVQGANLVAVEIAQIGEIKLTRGGFTHSGWVLDRRAAGGDASIVPCPDLFRR